MVVLAYSACKYSIFLLCTKYFTDIFQRKKGNLINYQLFNYRKKFQTRPNLKEKSR